MVESRMKMMLDEKMLKSGIRCQVHTFLSLRKMIHIFPKAVVTSNKMEPKKNSFQSFIPFFMAWFVLS